MKKIVLTGGGTAGHVTPNIALLPSLQEAGYEITYMGSYDGIEKKDLSTHGRPFFVSEYGGIAWTGDEKGWGYGMAPKSEEEFLTRLKGLTDVLMDHPKMFGLCYTQLTDVEQEKNGLYTYDRKPKFAPEKIYPIFARAAAIEQE